VGKSDLCTVFKQDCIKLVWLVQNQLSVCVVLSKEMMKINEFLFRKW